MDASRFDALARSLTTTPTRRGLLTGALTALGLGLGRVDDALADKDAGGRGGREHGRNRGHRPGKGKDNRTGKREDGKDRTNNGDRQRTYGESCAADGDCVSNRCAAAIGGGTVCACTADVDCVGGRTCLASGTCARPCAVDGCAGCSRACLGTNDGGFCGNVGVVGGCAGSNADCPVGSVCSGVACELAC